MFVVMPLVSVILTTHNRADLLEKCVGSILRQTYSNLEVVIVDDCSTDHTPLVIERLCIRDGRIRSVRHEVNRGNACSRNTAVRHSRGRYLAFMDDDDHWIHDEKLTMQVNGLEQAQPEVGICCSNVMLSGGSGESAIFPKIFPQGLEDCILRGNSVIYNSTVMIRRSLFDAVGGFDERMPRGIDSEFFRNAICRHRCQVLFLSEVTAHVDAFLAVRMTTRHGVREAGRLLFAHAYLLWKYRWQYLRHPGSLMVRLRLFFRTPLKALLE